MNTLAHDKAAVKDVSVWVSVDALTVTFAIAAVLTNIPTAIIVLESSGLQVHFFSHVAA